MADLRDDPVPTTSPTNASGWPFSFNFSMSPIGSSILLTSMALACSGISGRLQASVAGDRSSVFVSPGTLNTVNVICSANLGREVNHSASAQDCNTRMAYSLLSAFSTTSW